MVHIQSKKGLEIPISGEVTSNIVASLTAPKQVALDLSTFEELKFKLLVSEDDEVQIGQPLAEDKLMPGRFFVAPAAGKIVEIRRGLKRRLLAVVIERAEEETYYDYGKRVEPASATPEEIKEYLKLGGLFSTIRMRPFNLLANPNHTPRTIFVSAVESAPFIPHAEFQVKGYEEAFQAGLTTLSKLTEGNVHLVHHQDSNCQAFVDAQDVDIHTVKGKHPIGNPSVHIHHIDPVQSIEDIIWTVNAHDVVSIGVLMLTGKKHLERIISVAGPGVLSGKREYLRAREGYPIGGLVVGRNKAGSQRYISGDPLTGHTVHVEDFLGVNHYSFVIIPENTTQEFLHFFRPGFGKYSATRAYISGHLPPSRRRYHFTTNQHGEERAFVESTVYDRLMPMCIPTMALLKAVISEDFDAAEELGFLEVDSADFALASFICPSKIEMVEIMHQAQKEYGMEALH